MSDRQPLSSQQADSVRAAIRLLRKIHDCASRIPASQRSGAWNDDQLKEVDRVATALDGLLGEGKIDSSEEPTNVEAKADGEGIHINRKFDGNWEGAYRLEKDWRLDDCREGDFDSPWELLGVLAHELYHYEHHTGFWGSLLKLIEVAVALPADLFLRVAGKQLGLGTPSSLLGHENFAYMYAKYLLLSLKYMLSDICRDAPHCVPCCEGHIRAIQTPIDKQEYLE